ncbi:ABC transporter permease [Synechococcus sp. PCC 6312]|uniref:ABC transporter permease n=1 Tax=Synechococcus sp. (strain ATCC 27167 / PCC 6312) TaxID=195253 RepID=UPI00029EC660|nr:ABC transporter permease [Synechococcus sp. PCC 6312]AFY62267.1 ABC-type polysaccharide/polyol phosphate export systems, permease component [Synechococcus sp. PCC 6312]
MFYPSFAKTLPAHLSLLHALVKRELESYYKGSVLGNLWSLLKQLSQLLIYTYVFGIVLKVKLTLANLPENNFIFGLWLFAGLIPWTAFVTGVSQASTSVINQPNLVKKVLFPLTLLPLVPILAAFIESSLGLIVLIILTGFALHNVAWTLILLPLVWLPQLLFTAGLGYWCAGLTVFIRDIPQSLSVILNAWFYLTPLVYPAAVIPASIRPWVFRLNPLAAIAESYRDMVLGGNVDHWRDLGLATIISVVVFSTGLWVYRRLRPAFADVL